MKSVLDFEFETMPLETLIREAELYRLMKPKIQSALFDQTEKVRRYDILNIAELNTNISILYLYYKRNMIVDAFKIFELYGDNIPDKCSIYAVKWGNTEKKNKTMSLICKMLSELNVDVIAASEEKSSLYHQITEFIDSCRKENRKPFLNDVTFWQLFFAFYERYHEIN